MWSVVEDPDVLAGVHCASRETGSRSASTRARNGWPSIRGAIADRRTLSGLVSELAGAGVRRFVLSHGGASPDLELIRRLAASVEAGIVVAGGVDRASTLTGLQQAGAEAVILGEVLFDGRLEPTGCGRRGSPDALVTARFV